MFDSVANKLTVSRITFIPIILGLIIVPNIWAAWIGLAFFISAGITDWLDGYLARRENEVTRLGQFLDPIADKLLVAAVILVLVSTKQISGWSILPAIVILMREVAVSGLREFLADLRISVPVSRLAKWKTTIQMVALGFLIIGDRYAPSFIPATFIGDLGIWVASGLTVITAWDYWRASLKHF
ncbi:MAG: CDP-diacylglycerol--glycerol-3-phosphate 3-phosphatidyltransferase [Alphaproteobacteria bacterium]|nr:CDP-diacylglycerol--glycerol-3-phosphate 3-phosphatidyltransferase [Alphaproteobacteria bacterium]